MKTFAEAKKELETRYPEQKMLENQLETVEAYGFAKAIGFIFDKNEEMIPEYSKILTVLANIMVRLSAEQALNSLHEKEADNSKKDVKRFLWASHQIHFCATESDIDIWRECRNSKKCTSCSYAKQCPNELHNFPVCPEAYQLLTEDEFNKKMTEFCSGNTCTNCPYKYYCESSEEA